MSGISNMVRNFGQKIGGVHVLVNGFSSTTGIGKQSKISCRFGDRAARSGRPGSPGRVPPGSRTAVLLDDGFGPRSTVEPFSTRTAFTGHLSSVRSVKLLGKGCRLAA
ncbi:hypothetical protein ACWCQQ_02485 [Streptomyces sp. NPDC002143]